MMKRNEKLRDALHRAARFACAVLLLVSLLLPEYAPMVQTAEAVTQADIDKLNVFSLGVIDLSDPKIVSGEPFVRPLNLAENLTNIQKF